uniref:B3 DNA binding domain-containing protein n=1 Tax=Tanacetum cinerariifolium TaxID=118510 RepID=A0A6L2M3H0_TANCI|nr:B3 DNA binding domain-containing protein [Tanacetum cinerariifolium]
MEKKIKDLHSLLFGDVTIAMAAPFSRFDIKTSNFASTSHFQSLLLCAPSSSTPRNLDLNKLPVPEEDQPAPIRIDYPMALEYSFDFLAYSFQEVKTFEDFHIVVNGHCVDHELPDNIRSGYYRLCFQEKEFLHNGILEHHSPTYVVGMIGETVNISQKIKNYSFTTTTKEELDRWDNILEAFELSGMKNYREVANELKLIEDEIARVASEIRKLKQTATKCEGNLCSFKQKAEKYKNAFQELVDAPWFNVLEEDQPAPLKIVGSDPSSHPSLSLQKRSLAVMKAKEFQSSLGSDFPSCYKMMVRSYVTSGSSLGLPTDFCKSCLPKKLPNHVHFVLEDEKGEQWEVKYFTYNFRISAGWKKFVDAHKLVEGDVLIFQLVKPTKFKVYIVKVNNGIEVDGSLSLMNVETQAEQMALVASTSRLKRREHTESLSLTVVPKKPRTHRVSFNIVYRGLCIDNELSDDMRSSYYRLCSQKKQLLHDGLPEGLYTKLVVGMIGQTVSIAAKIKNTKLNTTKEELENWDSILKAFELLGMKVAFLRDKIHLLATCLFESEATPDIQSYTESKCEIERVEREIPKLKEKLKTLKETAKKCTKVLDSLRRKVEPYENIFKEVAAVPW